MARETKAERQAREAREAEALFEELQATYPARLMAMLERAMNANYELTVRNGQFELTDRDDRDNQFALTLEFNLENRFTFETMEWTLEIKETAAREAERQRQVRKAALAKLNDEERKLLGL